MPIPDTEVPGDGVKAQSSLKKGDTRAHIPAAEGITSTRPWLLHQGPKGELLHAFKSSLAQTTARE